MTDLIQGFDFTVLDGIQNFLKCGFFDKIMPFISTAAGVVLWAALGIILIFFKKVRVNGIALLSAFLLTALITEFLIKPVFMRERPFMVNTEHILLVSEPFGSSFPSAHSSTSFAAAVQLFGINRKTGIMGIITAAVVAFSRLYLYVHFPTDVIAGALIGVFLGIAVMLITTKIRIKLTEKRQVQQ